MRVSIEQLKTALRRTGGNRLAAARILSISRQAVHQRIERSAPLQRLMRELDEEQNDLAEGRLTELVNEKDGASVRFRLSTKAKHRGYSTRQELTGADGGPMKHELDLTDLTEEELELLAEIQARAAARKKP